MLLVSPTWQPIYTIFRVNGKYWFCVLQCTIQGKTETRLFIRTLRKIVLTQSSKQSRLNSLSFCNMLAIDYNNCSTYLNVKAISQRGWWNQWPYCPCISQGELVGWNSGNNLTPVNTCSSRGETTLWLLDLARYNHIAEVSALLHIVMVCWFLAPLLAANVCCCCFLAGEGGIK